MTQWARSWCWPRTATPMCRWVVERSFPAFNATVWQACSPTDDSCDFDELAGYDFAAYCAGEATRWGGDEVTPFQANVPVVLKGVGVIPGQYVFADSSGAVVIPASHLDRVLAEARSIEADDARSRAEIAREDGPPA